MAGEDRPFDDLLACPACEGALPALACKPCGASYPSPDGIPALLRPSDARTEAVRAFYAQAPFPGYGPGETLATLRSRARRSEFARCLDEAIPAGATVLEVGCGTGQMSLFLATAERVIVGADIARPSLELAAQAARRFGISRALFVETDLQAPGLRRAAFDVVYSSGVLHHTPDPRRSFAALARLVRPGGIVVLGLYNTFARIPHRLRRGAARVTGFRVIPFDPILRARSSSPERRAAWFRDQYLHPEEHRHTLGEVKRWLAENGIDYLRTYPSALLGSDPPSAGELFSRAEDDWGIENLVSQLAWMRTLAAEGGLFVTIGRRRASAETDPVALGA